MAAASAWNSTALAQLAADTGCSSIDIQSTGKVHALFGSCVAVCVIAAIVLTALHYWWFVRRANRLEFIEKVKRKHLEELQKHAGRPKKVVRGILVTSGNKEDAKPNLAKAKEYLKESSPTDGNDNWRSIWGTSIREIGLIGGPGLGLYFTLLVYLGLCFSYMWIFSIPLSVFNSLGDFAPEGSGAFPQLSIANLGTESTAGVPQENRLVVMGCQGVPVSDLTKYFGWLDFLGTLLFTVCAFWLCFKKVPETENELDEQAIQASDYSVQIDFLPERLGSDHANYEKHLETHLLQRLQEARVKQARFYKHNTPAPKVCDIVLVRDRNMKLGKQKQIAELELQKEIAEYKNDSDKAGKVQEKIDKLSKSIEDIANDQDLPVLRAFVTLNASDDVVALLFQYRFSRIWLTRQCQRQALQFQGSALRIQRATEPSNIFWENQDAPWKLRLFRKLLVWFICFVIVMLCLGLMYATSKQAQKLVQKYQSNSSPGSVSCNFDGSVTPAPPICSPDGWTVQSVSGSWVLFDSSNNQVPNQNEDIMDCFCSQTGIQKIIADDDLRGACEKMLMAYGTRLGITLLAALLVVVVNVAMAGFLMYIAAWEEPLTISELNNTQMMTVFISQTLNTACVVFAVHYENINDFQRGWYEVVGVAVCMTMAGNTVVNAACYLLIWGVAVLRRMCTGVGGKHQAELEQIYTNPPWDMASRYAYLLMTVYVTVIYSSGMPILNFLAILYCFFSYWSDKLVLLRGSARPPQYDAKMPKRTAWWLIYAGAIHCCAAIAMYGHPCVFPSNPLGGTLGVLGGATNTAGQAALRSAADANGRIEDKRLRGMATTFFDRLSRDATWMFGIMLFVMVSLCVLYIFLKAVGSTCGECLRIVKVSLCPARVKVVPEGQSSVPWPQAAIEVDRERPPASYRIEDHPDFKFLAKYMRTFSGTFHLTK